MKLTTLTMGGLTTRVVDALDGPPELAVVVCHGFGAPGTDLVDLGAYMLSRSDRLAATTRFYFPEAPLDLSSMGMWGSRAWWMIDMEALNQALADGTFRDRARNDQPEGLAEARTALLALIGEITETTGLPASRIALGGFSQGAMLTTDVTLHLDTTPAGLFIWSGTLLNEDVWRARAKQHTGLKVVQSHGHQDPLLSFAWAEDLRNVLTESGLKVDWVPFDGPHTVGEEALEHTIKLLESAV